MEFTRWRRFGHDRLYVRDDVGADLGYWDLTANEARPKDAAAEAWLVQAVAVWRSSNRERLVRQTPAAAATSSLPGPNFEPPASLTPTPIPPEVPVDAAAQNRPAVDLILNTPGQQLTAQIQEAHRAGQRPTLLRRLFLGKHAYSTWERGAIGEWLVAEELFKLVTQDLRWGFLNSIPVGDNGADIDHLVIGPGGVFTINTKYHKGCSIWVAGNTFMVNGDRQPYVRNSRHEARRASRLLKAASGIDVGVTGLVVPVDARSVTIREQPADVVVVNRMRLVELLLSRPPVLRLEQVERLFEHARLDSTWVGAKRS